jgi:hypothetical protein
MNITPTQTLSSREVLARSGIDSSCGLDRKRAKKRRERMHTGQPASTSTIPGMEVTYIEFDEQCWRELTATR